MNPSFNEKMNEIGKNLLINITVFEYTNWYARDMRKKKRKKSFLILDKIVN